MARTIDGNLYGYLQALIELAPEGEDWIQSWALIPEAKKHGADVFATSGPEGAFAVMKQAYKLKLVDKVEGRATKMDNGYAINEAGKLAVLDWRQQQGLDEKEETT